MISFLCSRCGRSLKVKEELAGRMGRCPHCMEPMIVPAAGDADGQADARTVLPATGDAVRDLKTMLPAAPRSKAVPRKDNTLVPAAAAATAFNAELYDFLAPPQGEGELGRLGNYRVLKVLGAGGMGVVFQAEDPALKRLVALKAMLPALAASPSNKERFLREAQAAAAIEHDHIVHIYQVAEDRNVPYIAMQFLKGEPLEDRLKRERKLPIAEVLRIGRETAAGLAAAHENGLIHRDIKPANVWLEGERGRVKILDFGLARSSGGDSHLTQQGAIIGTPAYMAPEQASGKAVDSRCDLFSLGCMLYRMATGQLPFKGADTVSTIVAVATETPRSPRQLNPDVSPRLSRFILDLLAKDPNERPPSAHSVIEELQELERESPPDRTELDEPPTRVRVIRADSQDTIRRRPGEQGRYEDEAEGAPAARSMLPWLIGGVAGLLGLLLIAVVVLIVVIKKKNTPEVVQVENKPAENVNAHQPPPVNPNPNPIVNPNPGGGRPVRDPGKQRPPIGVPPAPGPQPAGPRAADRTFKPYSSRVTEIRFAPDGKHFVSIAFNNPRLDYWDLAAGKVLQQFDLGDNIRHCRVSADGARVAAFSYKRAAVWEAATGKTLASLTPLPRHVINGLDLLGGRDIRLVQTTTVGQENLIKVCDGLSNQCLSTLPCPRSVYHVWISSDGTRALSWGSDRYLRSWDLGANRLLTTFPVAPKTSKCIAVSSGFTRVMGTFHESDVHLYDIATSTELRDIRPQNVETDAVAFGAGDKVGVTGGFTGITRILDLETGQIKKELKAGSRVTAVALSPDGKTVLSGDQGGTLYVHKLDD